MNMENVLNEIVNSSFEKTIEKFEMKDGYNVIGEFLNGKDSMSVRDLACLEFDLELLFNEEFRSFYSAFKKEIFQKLEQELEDIDLGSDGGVDWAGVLVNNTAVALEPVKKIFLNLSNFSFVTRNEYLDACEALAAILKKEKSQKALAGANLGIDRGAEIRDRLISFICELAGEGASDESSRPNIKSFILGMLASVDNMKKLEGEKSKKKSKSAEKEDEENKMEDEIRAKIVEYVGIVASRNGGGEEYWAGIKNRVKNLEIEGALEAFESIRK